MSSASILVVEDEPAIQELVAHACGASGFTVRRALTVREAEAEIRADLPDLVLLDWMLPDRSGIELLRGLRGHMRTAGLPVIMLTARGTEQDRVTGLEAGADDFVVKPFSPRELAARVRALLRRRAPHVSSEALCYGSIRVDPVRYEVTVDERPVKLALAEFKLLRFLVGHPELVLSRSQLLDGVWGDHVFIEERTIDVHMLRLRKALKPVGGHHFVQTVRGVGYRLQAPSRT